MKDARGPVLSDRGLVFIVDHDAPSADVLQVLLENDGYAVRRTARRRDTRHVAIGVVRERYDPQVRQGLGQHPAGVVVGEAHRPVLGIRHALHEPLREVSGRSKNKNQVEGNIIVSPDSSRRKPNRSKSP